MSETKPTDNLDKVKKEIEKKTEYKTINAILSKQVFNPTYMKETQQTEQLHHSQEVLLNIMKEGADEFTQKTGRPMTYSEMREMYG